MTCPCECEVCIVLYPVFAQSSRELRDSVVRIRKCFRFGQAQKFTNFARRSREFRMNSYTIPFHFILRSYGTAGTPIPVPPCMPTSDFARPGTLMLLHRWAQSAT